MHEPSAIHNGPAGRETAEGVDPIAIVDVRPNPQSEIRNPQ
jgi:hypothetical protein